MLNEEGSLSNINLVSKKLTYLYLKNIGNKVTFLKKLFQIRAQAEIVQLPRY